ncbi:type II toxin-antitoxin system VapC family toxin [Mucilaginibacter arboris]|uniref:Ribonuclease VapC n=1 Tax=Mucilaginibacter arboris TaxID=2682090 RepID=A0A7K1T139_9SPHI|nr:type II toxin-antitoxin system VapC family toxin [Mucilaginibacter arboris]MVN23286.1 PIN domain-containing protein [Mucilaginibacter arboris]
MVVDTSIFVQHLRAKDKSATTLYQLINSNNLFISSVSLYELYMGATTPDKVKDIERIIEGLSILSFTGSVAIKAAQIYHQLKQSNQQIEFRDIFIAATCLVNNLPIATLNKKLFVRIVGLEVI